MLLLFFAIVTQIQFAQIPVTLGDESEWRTVYITPIEDIKQGDLIQAFGEGQVRNELGYNVEIVQTIEIKTEAQMTGGTEPLNGIYYSPLNGWNITTVVHYGRFSKMLAWKADKDYGTLYAALRIRCRSSVAKPGHQLDIQSGYGMLFVNKFR